MRRWLAVGFVVVAGSSGGCAWVLPYEGDPENTLDACFDRRDNDFDGVTDCADSDCWAVSRDADDALASVAPRLCQESVGHAMGAGLCADGLDNDEDGFRDRFDIGCGATDWADNVVRCTSIRGSRIESLERSASEWSRSASFVPDPSGRFVEVLALRDGSPVLLERTLTGAKAGTEIALVVRLPERGGVVELSLETVDPFPFAGSFGARLTAARNTTSLEAWTRPAEGPEVGDDPRQISVPDDGWIDLRFRFDPPDWTVSVGTTTSRTVDVPSVAAPAYRFALEARLDGSDQVAWVGAFAVTRSPEHPCRTPVPPVDADAPGRVWALTASPDMYCLLFERWPQREIVVLRGERLPTSPVIGTPPPLPVFESTGTFRVRGGVDLRDAVISWDQIHERFVGTGVEYVDGRPTDTLWMFARDACGDEWELLGAPVSGPRAWSFAGLGGGVVGHLVLPTGVHQLHVMTDGDGGVADFVQIWRSSTGEPGTFGLVFEPYAFGLTDQVRAPQFLVAEAGESLRQAEFFGARGSLAYVANGNSVIVLTPSGIPGTVDRAFIDQGIVWLPDPERGRVWFGLFAYTARECADCEPRLALSHVAPGGLVPF